MPKDLPPSLRPKIIFEDPNLIILSKPAGLLSQGARKNDPNLVDWLRNYLGRHYVGLVHRLDRNVSGIMVVAKRSKAAARLTKALQEGTLQRWYLAWLIGRLARPGKWKHFLIKDEQKNQVKVSRSRNRNAKEALLEVRPTGYGNWGGKTLTLAEFRLQTGRSHQIRAQSAFEGYPLLGDPKYGNANSKQAFFSRPALHSFRISFPHPISGEILNFEDPLPPELDEISHLLSS